MGNQQPLNGSGGGGDPRVVGQGGPMPHGGGYGPGGGAYPGAPRQPAPGAYGYPEGYDTGKVAEAPMDAEQQHRVDWLDDDTVPTVFRWEHGGRQVYITGTFNGWSRQIPMHRSGNDFTYIHNLKRGKHAFKFIVDDEWRFAPDQPTVADIEGRINNFIDVTEFKAYTGDKDFEKEKAAAEYGGGAQEATAGSTTPTATATSSTTSETAGASADQAAETTDPKEAGENRPDRDGEVFSQNMPDLDEYTKEPPPLPPHLRHIILNKPPQLQDTAALPVPQHVALNHLYCTAIRDNMMVLGITQRYKTKFVTTVYYSPCASK
mmetsp:Transcript_31336/g.72130  ORF Transcript_31336/g.72130 Transcript_31336/m.72130 type:complete len:320 (+) Transcript_31336:173-1132(+)